MTTTTTVNPYPLHTFVRFARRSSRGFWFGLSGPRAACIAASLLVFIPSLILGLGAVLATSLLWCGLVVAAFKQWGGVVVADLAPTAGHYLTRRIERQATYKYRPGKPLTLGAMPLPGAQARLRFLQDPLTGAVMIHDPHAQTMTAVAQVRHPGYALLAPDDQARRVASWGRVLAGLTTSGTCARVQILERSQPDSGVGISQWWDTHRAKQDVPYATEQYAALMTSKAPSAASHSTLIAYALDLRAAGKAVKAAGRGMTGAAAVLGQDMQAFEQSLRSADLGVPGWMGEGDLSRLVRSTYDPAEAAALDGTTLGRDLPSAGPMAVEEHWGHIRHDSGFSAVIWISEWPRIDVLSHFLHGIQFVGGVTHTLSITVTPLTHAEAMGDIRKAKIDNRLDVKAKEERGFVTDLADEQEMEDVQVRERALISGHADLRFTGLLAVTAKSKEDLDAAVSKVRRAAHGASCETRVLHGQQARAFPAAALPLALEVH